MNDNILNSSCIFCDYNGKNFYQKHAHEAWCPFYSIGGVLNREEALRNIIKKHCVFPERNSSKSWTANY